MRKTVKAGVLAGTLIAVSLFLAGCSEKSPQEITPQNLSKNRAGDGSEMPVDKLTVGQKENTAPAANTANNSTKPTMQIDKTKKYQAVLKTMAGDITIDLFADKTPLTANNFVTLARDKFYDGTIFHRVIKGFMIQGGDPKGDGTGGPGYQFEDEPFTGEYTRGTVAMANAGPNTNGSQFFIMHQDYALPKNYVIFGKVSQGLDVVDKIAEAPVGMSVSGESSKPLEPVKVNSVEIKEN